MPVGTIIAFSGTMQEAVAQQEFGWWVADDRQVTDPAAKAYFQKKTPDLRDRFVIGGQSAGEKAGDLKATVPAKTITSYTTGKWGAPFYGDPFTHMQGPHGWTTDAAIESQGTFPQTTIDVPPPPFYRVIYLIKVK